MSTPVKEWSYFGYLKTMQPYFNDSKLKSLRSVWKKRFNEIIKHTDEERSKAAWVLINQFCKHYISSQSQNHATVYYTTREQVTPCELPELGDVLGVIYGVYGCTTREQVTPCELPELGDVLGAMCIKLSALYQASVIKTCLEIGYCNSNYSLLFLEKNFKCR